MKKQQPETTITNDKIGLKTETLRKMSETLSDDQLKEVAGGRRPYSYVSGTC